MRKIGNNMTTINRNAIYSFISGFHMNELKRVIENNDTSNIEEIMAYAYGPDYIKNKEYKKLQDKCIIYNYLYKNYTWEDTFKESYRLISNNIFSKDFYDIILQYTDSYFISIIFNYNWDYTFFHLDGEMVKCVPFTKIEKMNLNDDNLFNSKYAVSIKIGRFIRMILENSYVNKEKYSNIYKNIDNYVEKLSNSIKSKKICADFEITDDIRKYYNSDNYESKSGSLGGSCLNNIGSTLVKFYKDNNCKLLILKDSYGKIKGRALIWEAYDDKDNMITYMDTPYAISDIVINMFREYAMKNKFYQRKSLSSREPNYVIDPNGEVVEKILYIKNNYTSLNGTYYPYLDTFKFTSDLKKIYNNQKQIIPLKNVSKYGNNCIICLGFYGSVATLVSMPDNYTTKDWKDIFESCSIYKNTDYVDDNGNYILRNMIEK